MNPHDPNVILVGTGVVGRAIMKAHIDADVSIRVVDQCESSIRESLAQLSLDLTRWTISEIEMLDGQLPSIAIRLDQEPLDLPTIVIESIAERLDAKQKFFADVERLAGEDAILCSNTSTLRIGDIGEALARPQRLCGMHFFMPVQGRWAVEVVRANATDSSTIDICQAHVRRIQKTPLVVGDSPGFIVNRLLSPYLNEAMLLLGRGVGADQLERAAKAYGMPMSPLELVDWIGTRTMFDAGRAFWQAFPTRFDPSPILAALIKSKRTGRASGAGVYDYQNGVRSKQLAPVTELFCERYRRNVTRLSDEQVMLVLSIPMWIEAAFAFRERVAVAHEQFDLAMRGGLGYQSGGTWLEFFESVGSQRMIEMIERFSPTTKSLRAPAELTDSLRRGSPTAALDQFALDQFARDQFARDQFARDQFAR